jgi:hypothetical protein
MLNGSTISWAYIDCAWSPELQYSEMLLCSSPKAIKLLVGEMSNESAMAPPVSSCNKQTILIYKSRREPLYLLGTVDVLYLVTNVRILIAALLYAGPQCCRYGSGCLWAYRIRTVNQRYGSGSFYRQAKNSKRNLDSYRTVFSDLFMKFNIEKRCKCTTK